MSIQQETIAGIAPEATPLLLEHWREIAHFQDIELDPNWEAYFELERAGFVRCYTARAGAELVGYLVFVVRPSLHYRRSLQAWQDVLFLRQQYRRGATGIRLLKGAEDALRAEGVQVVYHHAKFSTRVGELLEHLGYELVDGLYAKRLDKRS